MLKFLYLLMISASSLAVISPSYAMSNGAYVSGIADGFPPYQYKDINAQTTGFDADVIRMVFQKMDKQLIFEQMPWNDVMGTLMYTDKLDCVVGMEINDIRIKHFDFTSPYYFRKASLFTLLETNSIHQLKDLVGKTIAGDRNSTLEKQLKQLGIRKDIRIKQTKSKEESMQLLNTGKISAMIAPKEVGLYLAEKMHIKVQIITELDEGTPVAIAVKKGNIQLLNLLEEQIQLLVKENEIQKMQQAWFH